MKSTNGETGWSTKVNTGTFIVSFIASLAVVIFIYWGVRQVSSWWLRKRAIGEAECWFLPRWNCFRLVIRNIPGHHTLHFIKWRIWLRQVTLRQAGCSVDTYVDTDIGLGERIFLPMGQDLPMTCFRFQESKGDIRLIVTDKLGTPLNAYELNNVDSIMAEYHVTVRHWFVFRHDVNRIVLMPLAKEQIKGRPIDFLRDYYLTKQKLFAQEQLESKVRVYKLEEEITAEL